MTNSRYDAIVVGGGHNGLVAGAYLARAGLRTVVLEARDDIGGAARTEQPWGPEFKVTALSYVMSLMPPTIIKDLSLERHGYHVLPMGPSYIAFPDGRSMLLHDEPSRNIDEVSKFSRHDAANLADYEAWLAGLADVLGPLLLTTPPKLGSRHPRDLVDMLRLAWGVRGLDVRTTAEATRLMTTSISDLLARWFESPELKGVLAVNGIIGTWAGPDEPGTAYVMAHHSIGDVGDGHLGSWGYPIGGMGAVSEAIRRAAVELGCEVRTGAPVEEITVANGKTRGVVLKNGEVLTADTVVAATHPQITFLRQIARSELPADFVRDLEAWRSRSGVVKVNVALSELPDFIADPGTQMHERYTGAVELCHSLEYLERAFQDAREGRAATRPFSDGVIPSTLDPSIAPDGMHVMSLFTQWVPHEWAGESHAAELESYADRVVDGYTELAPNFKQSIVHRQVIGPYEMEHEYGLIGGNIFHGELSADQLFHLRPAPGYADFTTPVDGLYQCSSATHGGGGVTGIPALLCTRRILGDMKRAQWKNRLRLRGSMAG
jgi:phytoene dehydrogenase-like protein